MIFQGAGRSSWFETKSLCKLTLVERWPEVFQIQRQLRCIGKISNPCHDHDRKLVLFKFLVQNLEPFLDALCNTIGTKYHQPWSVARIFTKWVNDVQNIFAESYCCPASCTHLWLARKVHPPWLWAERGFRSPSRFLWRNGRRGWAVRHRLSRPRP